MTDFTQSFPPTRTFLHTLRKDNWWLGPLATAAGLLLFVVYSTWAAFQGEHYQWGPYLSPFYSPVAFVETSAAGAAPLAFGIEKRQRGREQASGLALAPLDPNLDLLHRGRAGQINPLVLNRGAGTTDLAFDVAILPWGDGASVLVLARDITLERSLRAALIESRQRYKDLVEAASDFAWETDAQGRFTFVSSGGALGYSAAELVGAAAISPWNEACARP